jgi:hypothetical protein
VDQIQMAVLVVAQVGMVAVELRYGAELAVVLATLEV